MSSQLKRKAEEESDAQILILRKRKFQLDDERTFYKGLAELVRSAYVNRNLEQPLYTLFGVAAHAISRSVTASEPYGSISVEQQYRFGPRFSVKGPQRDIKLTSEIPDFVRLLQPCFDSGTQIFPEESEEGAVYLLVDFCEIKPLNVGKGVKWDSEEAMEMAELDIPQHIFQIYSQTMAGFFHNTDWKLAYVMLVIGIYFSQFRWTRPTGEILPPVHYDYMKSIPTHKLSPVEYRHMVEGLDAAIEECEARVEPKILAWNHPIISLRGPDASLSDPLLKLTDGFLWSMRVPLKHLPNMHFQHTWNSPPGFRPAELDKGIKGARKVIKNALVDVPLDSLRSHLAAVRENVCTPVAQGDGGSDATDPEYPIEKVCDKNGRIEPDISPSCYRVTRQRARHMGLLPQGQQAPEAILAAAAALGTLGVPLPVTGDNGTGSEDEDSWLESGIQPMASLIAESSSTGTQVLPIPGVAHAEPPTQAVAPVAAVPGPLSVSDILFPDREGDDAEEEEVDNLLMAPAMNLDWTTNVFL